MDGLIYLTYPFLDGEDRLVKNSSPRASGSKSPKYSNKWQHYTTDLCNNENDYMKLAENLECNGRYEEAYNACKAAVNFLKGFEKVENEYDHKRALKHKIEICSLRAEKLYNMYLAPEVKDLQPKPEQKVKKDNKQKQAISEIYRYSVIKKGDTGMLVLHLDTQKTFYVKVINKTTSFSDDNLIIPESVPYMVQLHNFFNCDNSLFLILEYVNGSKLSEYLKKMKLKFENNETFENLYDKAVDLDIPDDDSESSFSELVTNYAKTKKDSTSEYDYKENSENSLTETNSTLFQHLQSIDCNQTSDTETESNIDIPQYEVIVKWAAQLVLALEKLHTLGIVCKDLRLHNLLVNEKGDLTLTYMCNAEESYGIFINKKDLNLAPEVQGIGPVEEEADWWSFGAIFYEILVGMSLNDLHPEYFHRSTILRVPKYVSPEGRSILRQLLVYEPKKRLGAGPHGVDNLKSHPFFKGVDWNALLEQSLK